jgi:hypothetical protein
VVQWWEFLAAEDVLCFLWSTNWSYICYLEESRPPLWSSGQSSWLQNGDVLCFLWSTNWSYICYLEESRPPLWSNSQEFLATQRMLWAGFIYLRVWPVMPSCEHSHETSSTFQSCSFHHWMSNYLLHSHVKRDWRRLLSEVSAVDESFALRSTWPLFTLPLWNASSPLALHQHGSSRYSRVHLRRNVFSSWRTACLLCKKGLNLQHNGEAMSLGLSTCLIS